MQNAARRGCVACKSLIGQHTFGGISKEALTSKAHVRAGRQDTTTTSGRPTPKISEPQSRSARLYLFSNPCPHQRAPAATATQQQQA